MSVEVKRVVWKMYFRHLWTHDLDMREHDRSDLEYESAIFMWNFGTSSYTGEGSLGFGGDETVRTRDCRTNLEGNSEMGEISKRCLTFIYSVGG